MSRAALALALALLSGPVLAQPRDFSCVGAEELEADIATLAFALRTDRLPEGASWALTPIAVLAREESARNICVLGYASAEEGGAQTASRLAARRARAVAEELSRQGVERDRIRAETRTRGFTPGQRDRLAGVRVVLMPGEPAPLIAPPPGIPIRY